MGQREVANYSRRMLVPSRIISLVADSRLSAVSLVLSVLFFLPGFQSALNCRRNRTHKLCWIWGALARACRY